MKIALISNSLLLTKSLEIYLRDYLTSYKMCDFIVATEPMEANKPVFLIGDFSETNLNKPFTKEILLEKLESFYWRINHQEDLQQENSLDNTKNADYLFNDVKEQRLVIKESDIELQQKIQEVLERYTQEIVSLSMEYLKGKNA
ncbi:hypothetical protein LS72_002490 [Helicobacter apodemus]|uniref:Uncharacterized protein n=1 Tax=Helicobacter apodemus TaxID=135569 RepID=A0A4U8UFC9_9HELI|nr:hypothetical protein [Helicobacter apodemus]TLE16513.1 hypothetical protein LS72_002490 [Helicobacter apodemus]